MERCYRNAVTDALAASTIGRPIGPHASRRGTRDGELHDHLGRRPRRGRDPRVPRLPRIGVPRRLRRVGRRLPGAVRRPRGTRREPQLGQRPSTGTSSRTTASSPRCCSRTPSHPSTPAARSPPRHLRRTPVTSTNGGPACARTTAGSPTSARRRPGGAPASRRSCSTTSTPRSPRSAGRRTPASPAACCCRARHRAPASQPLYKPVYEPIWAVCEELELPVNHHSGSAVPPLDDTPEDKVIFLLEVTWWANRTLWHLLVGGAMERHPNLQFVFTEQGTAWIPERLAILDYFFDRMRGGAGGGASQELEWGGPVRKLSLQPSEYWARQCHVGSSFIRPAEVPLRYAVGVDKIMWGCDYPHKEASYPYSREALRLAFAGVDEAEVRAMVGGNAAALYGFDLDALAPVAEKFGPTVEDARDATGLRRRPGRARPSARRSHHRCPEIRGDGHGEDPVRGAFRGGAAQPGARGDIGGSVGNRAHRDLHDRSRCDRGRAPTAARADRRGARPHHDGVGRHPRPADLRRRDLRRAGPPRGHDRRLPAGDAHEHRAVGDRRPRDVRGAQEARRRPADA